MATRIQLSLIDFIGPHLQREAKRIACKIRIPRSMDWREVINVFDCVSLRSACVIVFHF